MKNKKKKKVMIVSIMIIALMLVGGIKLYTSSEDNGIKKVLQEIAVKLHLKEEVIKQTKGVEVVPTMLDPISKDSAWRGTFQLVWNDMMDEIVGGDVIFTPQIAIANNLNKQQFSKDMISSEYYYKKYGLKTLELKEEIEKGINKKFNQKSDILEKFDWSNDGLDKDGTRYFFYSMLYRKFEYLKEFEELETDTFGEDYDDVKYFGFYDTEDKEVRNQIKILYYNSEEDFAISIQTKSNDEVIFYKNPKGDNFEQIYENMLKLAEDYTGDTELSAEDEFRAPYIDVYVEKEYEELQNKCFKTNDPKYPEATIIKAIQSIQFSLDEKGGEVKSEAAIDMEKNSAARPSDDIKYLFVDATFALFIREKGKEKPYFAAKVEDIDKWRVKQ